MEQAASSDWSAYSLTLKTEAVHSSENLVNMYQNKRHHIPEDSTLRGHLPTSSEHCLFYFIPTWIYIATAQLHGVRCQEKRSVNAERGGRKRSLHVWTFAWRDRGNPSKSSITMNWTRPFPNIRKEYCLLGRKVRFSDFNGTWCRWSATGKLPQAWSTWQP